MDAAIRVQQNLKSKFLRLRHKITQKSASKDFIKTFLLIFFSNVFGTFFKQTLSKR